MNSPRLLQVPGMTGPATATRNRNAVRFLVIHHSATATGSQRIFENHWRGTLGWQTGGYAEIVLRNADVEIVYPPETISNGARGQNHNTMHFCLVGNGSFTPEQLQSLESRIRHWMGVLNIPAQNVLVHHELPGQATTCVPASGFDIAAFRSRLAPRTPEAPQSPDTTFLVHTALNGHQTAGDAQTGNNPRSTVSPGTYHVFREHAGMLNLTKTPGTAGAWVNPTLNVARTFPRADGTGIVAALNSIGVDSSFSFRSVIAKANLIHAYSGTVAQNNQLLELLRTGRLLRP